MWTVGEVVAAVVVSGFVVVVIFAARAWMDKTFGGDDE